MCLPQKQDSIFQYQIPQTSLDPLPEDWIEALHSSGVPFYVHKSTKVITWSRPYAAPNITINDMKVGRPINSFFLFCICCSFCLVGSVAEWVPF